MDSLKYSGPKVSVITIVYNNSRFIEKTIQSVINQTYSNLDYVIIDGGSTDGTVDIIKKYDSRIRYWISEKDKGIYDAMNKGQKASVGEYIIFMNSGDLFADNSVLEQIFSSNSHRYKNEYADVYYGETYLMDETGKILGTRSALTTRKLPKNMTWKSMKHGMIVSHQSIFVKKMLAPEYNLHYKCSADIDWVIQSLKNSRKIVNTQLIISKYLVGGYSIANQKRCWQERYEIYKKYYGLFTTLWVHGLIIFNNVIFKLKGKKNY
ncbi:MAG: glycosyltransferase [Cytophagaceae bacterium]|nr:glycosyltransferase [Cytophagaceae bacterium]